MRKIHILLNLATVIFLLALPYYLFDDKLYVGGDDTRLFYTFPVEFIKNVSFFSWSNEATIGINSPTQFILPFLTIWSILDFFITSKIILTYLAFSLPLIIGFLFFQKSVKELFSLGTENRLEIYLGSFFYIFSPILILDQYFIFLTTIWLVGLIPVVIYLFIRYLKTSNFKYVLLASISCLVLSAALYSVPWIVGFLLPIFLGLSLLSFFFKRREKLKFIKKFIVFFGFIALTQLHWLANFVLSFIVKDSNSFSQKFISKEFVDTFTPTILTTATGNIFYPLLNLFHRQIHFDFVWSQREVFTNFYDKTLLINVIFVFVLFFGVLNYRKMFSEINRKIFLILLTSFILSLYFFTVNIGPLKDLFLTFKYIPGFLMLRNFSDKFAPGFVIIYALLITLSLVIVREKIKYHMIIFFFFFLAVVINFIPIKQTINTPLWTTKSIYRVVDIPEEYFNFMADIKKNVPSANLILNLPFGTSIYSVIKDENSENVYVGTSPVKIFSGIGDVSGHYSFNFTEVANTIDQLLLSQDHKKFNDVLYAYNINYVMLTKNIPDEVKNAWVFDKHMLRVQDEKFLRAITSEKIITSSEGNYELFKTKNKNSLIESENLYFKKISPVKYRIYIENIKNSQDLNFHDSYHGGWKLYINENPNKDWCEVSSFNEKLNTYECKQDERLFEKEDLAYIFKRNVFGDTQGIRDGFSNYWKVNPSHIKTNYPLNYHTMNKDGSVDMELVLYYVPQSYFYYGTLVTALFLSIGLIYLIKKR